MGVDNVQKKVVVLIIGGLMATITSVSLAQAQAASDPAGAPKPGASCVVPDGWWSMDPKRPEQPEPVKVVALQAMVTGVPGAWVQPLRGQLTQHQYHIASTRLAQCQ